ncbi:hypothetical protein QTP86_026341, partial [Hemibagrus guttatus]
KMRCLCCGDPDPDRTTKDSDTNSEDMVNDPAVQQLAEMNRTEADPGVEPLKERTGADESAEARSILADNVDTDIRKKAVEFYGSLYWSEVSGEHSTDSGFYKNLPQLTEETNASLKGAVSMGELHKALQSMKAGKAPGIDGLPVDFYKSLWEVVGEDVLLVLNESLAGGSLPVSCRRAVLALLPNKGDLTDIKNWRPVSVLCSDYKLLSKVLANRLAEVLGQVIHPEQTYCVPGRTIFDNISLARDVIDCSKGFKLDFGLISLDQEKAFDRVEHQSFGGPLPGGACPEHLSRETSWRHPKQMPEPPRLPPFDVEKQRLYSELLPGDRAPPG